MATWFFLMINVMDLKLFFNHIKQGNYVPRSLWCIIENEDSRNGYGLKMIRFDGKGEYQCIQVLGESYLIKSTIFDELRTRCPFCGIKTKLVNISKEIYTCDVCSKNFTSNLDSPLIQINIS